MFENVLGQSASLQLTSDVEAGRLAQSMLFEGPQASGKGTAALELGRVVSCEAEGGAARAYHFAHARADGGAHAGSDGFPDGKA